MAAASAQASTTGSVSGSAYVGGLVGFQDGNISQAYNTGSVTGGSGSLDVGGLVGYQYSGSISQTL